MRRRPINIEKEIEYIFQLLDKYGDNIDSINIPRKDIYIDDYKLLNERLRQTLTDNVMSECKSLGLPFEEAFKIHLKVSGSIVKIVNRIYIIDKEQHYFDDVLIDDDDF